MNRTSPSASSKSSGAATTFPARSGGGLGLFVKVRTWWPAARSRRAMKLPVELKAPVTTSTLAITPSWGFQRWSGQWTCSTISGDAIDPANRGRGCRAQQGDEGAAGEGSDKLHAPLLPAAEDAGRHAAIHGFAAAPPGGAGG